jgi:hypothetical protein
MGGHFRAGTCRVHDCRTQTKGDRLDGVHSERIVELIDKTRKTTV